MSTAAESRRPPLLAFALEGDGYPVGPRPTVYRPVGAPPPSLAGVPRVAAPRPCPPLLAFGLVGAAGAPAGAPGESPRARPRQTSIL